MADGRGFSYIRLCKACEEAGYTLGLSVTQAKYRGVHELHRLVVRDRAGLVAASKAVNGSLDLAAQAVLRRLAK